MSTTEAPRPVPSPSALRTELECRPEAVRHARHVTGAFLRALRPGPGQDLADAVVLVVSELVTNAVRHAGGATCCLRLSARPEAIALSVSDSSPVLPRPRTPDMAGEGGGFGWSMVCGIAEAVAVTEDPGGKTINAVIARTASVYP